MRKIYRIVPENDPDYDGVQRYEIQWSFPWLPWWERLDYRSYTLDKAKEVIDHLVKPPIYYRPK